jgi:formate hydrogenlyase subunit 3/multisubunit Na+/H+ antiporter MnhD subunit
MAGKLKQMFGGVFRSLHQLWLEVTGTFLVIIGVVLAYHVFQSYRTQTADGEKQIWQLLASVALSALALAFGIHSFWKSRNLR